MPSARLFTVKGRVQGVFFRDSTRHVAESLGITGYAVNLPNGDVEVLACGGRAAIAELASWLQQGPRMARVSEVIERTADYEDREAFTMG
jgi:acylphosphatase